MDLADGSNGASSASGNAGTSGSGTPGADAASPSTSGRGGSRTDTGASSSSSNGRDAGGYWDAKAVGGRGGSGVTRSEVADALRSDPDLQRLVAERRRAFYERNPQVGGFRV